MAEAMSDLSWSTNVDQLRPRAYQLEMLEASLKENIIVAVSGLPTRGPFIVT